MRCARGNRQNVVVAAQCGRDAARAADCCRVRAMGNEHRHTERCTPRPAPRAPEPADQSADVARRSYAAANEARADAEAPRA